jgi:hypothetical protein
MKKLLSLVFVAMIGSPLLAQKIDTIVFNLYTDSLKKGQHNYINVDGKYSNGKWLPLSAKEVEFSCASAQFDGNQLIIPENFKEEKVTVKVILKSDPSVVIQRTIWIKKKPDPALPTSDDIMREARRKRDRS